MSAPARHRETEALEDAAATEVDPRAALFLVIFAVSLLAGVPVVHLSLAPGPVLDALASVRHARSNTELQRTIASIDEALDDGSPVGGWVRPWVQSGLSHGLGVGNTQVHVGQGGWLFYRPTLKGLTGPGFLDRTLLDARSRRGPAWEPPPSPDPRPAIRHFHDDLRAAGIQLLLVPIPTKASFEAEHLGLETAPVDPDRAGFLHWARLQGISVLDVAALLEPVPSPRFLARDTHWRPGAMLAVARGIANRLEELGVPREESREVDTVRREGVGDLVGLLGIDGYQPESVVARVPRGRLPSNGPAPVVLLGDSFANIYEDPSLGFGSGAGLVANLEARLGVPVDGIVQNAGGASGTRAALAAEPDRLDEALVVVWVFTERALYEGDWRVLSMNLGAPTIESPFVPPPTEPTQLTVRVLETGPTPSPTAPYADQVVSIRIRTPDGEAWASLWGMRDRVLTPGGRAVVGTSLSVTATSFRDAPDAARSASRSGPDDQPASAPLWWLEVEP